MSLCLKGFLSDLVQQIGQSNVILDQRHYRLLLNLSALEKQALSKSALEWNWNVGSPIVMKFLQRTSIMSMSELMVYTYNQNAESAQLIFNDLLETEYMLLADVLKHANSTDPAGLSLCDLLNEGFKRLCNDIIENPNILAKNYLTEIDEYIQDECYEEVRQMHLKLLLLEGSKHSIDDSLGKQFTWNQEITNDHIVLNAFLQSIVGSDFPTRRNTFDAILDKCNDWLQQNWKCLSLLLRMIVDADNYQKFNAEERNAFKAMAKKFLKDTFRRSVDDEDESGFYVLFLVARQITRYNESILGEYGIWFKGTIGEMKYFLKNNEFTIAMQFLAGMVQLESDPDILDVHINTYIPAAPRCNDLVVNYKQLCRSRQMHLKSPDAHKSTVIEDEDADVFLIDDD